jgi:GTP-binding protein
VAYAPLPPADRGTFSIEPGTKVYLGMVVGEYTREQDAGQRLKTKQLTNVAAGSDENVRIEPAHLLDAGAGIECRADDEYLR